jgi:hypothetical protein
MKLRIGLLLLIAFGVTNLYAQKLKRKTQTTANIKEVFHIDRKTKIRQGRSYALRVDTKDTLSVGDYENGRRVGIWKFGHWKSGEEYLSYDFSSDVLIGMNDALLADSFLVKTGNEFVYRKVDRPLIYVGFNNELGVAISQKIDVSKEMQKGETGVSVLSFGVDKTGALTGAKVVAPFSSSIEQQINTIVAQLPGKFLPAIVDGQAGESQFYVRVNVGLPVERFAQNKKVPYLTHIDISTVAVERVTRRLGTVTTIHNSYTPQHRR